MVDLLAAIVDVNQFLLTAAGQALIADWDGFFGARNNYKIYHELERDSFVVFSWGLDQTFGMRVNAYNELNYCYDGSTSERANNLFFERCKQTPACWGLYRDTLAEAVTAWDAQTLLAEIDLIDEQIWSSVMDDSRSPWDVADYNNGMDNMRDFVAQRAGLVTQQLAQGCL